MGKKIPEVDAYIDRAAPFAKPILKRIRSAFHQGCPEIEEAIKWGIPYFSYQGILGGMAAFKNHVSFGFWKSKLMEDPAGILGNDPKASMCNAKFESLDQLPSLDVLKAYVAQAAHLNATDTKIPKPKAKRPPLEIPPIFSAALKKDKKAHAHFQAMPPSHQREYIEWILEAKQEATRDRRIETALEWLAEGKSRNWKYEKKSK